MPAVQRKGDKNNGDGVAERGIASVRVNNIDVVVNGMPVSAHPPYPRRGRNQHNNGSQKTANGLRSVRVENIPLVVTGNADTCGHSRVGGSPDVNAG